MSTSSIATEKFVMTPIPDHLVTRVMQFVAQETLKAQVTSAAPVADVVKSVAGGAVPTTAIDWTSVDNMKKLRAGLSTLPIGVIMMDMAAAAALDNPPDHKVTFEAVYKAAGFVVAQPARSTLGTFTRILKRDFCLNSEQAKESWPATRTYGELGEAFYEMSPAVATAWEQSAA